MAKDISDDTDTNDFTTRGVVDRLGRNAAALGAVNERLAAINSGLGQPPPGDLPSIRAAIDGVQAQVTAAQATVTALRAKVIT